LQLTLVDWSVVAFYFLLNLVIGLYYRPRAGKSAASLAWHRMVSLSYFGTGWNFV
jgi:hypothetical protein